MNTGADYLSLQETRWILGRSKNPGVGTLVALAAFDLIATAVIWYVSMLIVYILWNATSGQPIELTTAVDRDKGLPFFLSTFLTSAAWVLYLVSVIGIRIVMRQSRIFGLLLDAIAQSGSPTRMTATILSVLLVALYGISIGVIWVVQTAI